MALSDLRRLSYQVSTVLVDVEKGEGFTSESKKTLEKVIHDLKVMDQQTLGVSANVEHVPEGEVLMCIRMLKTHEAKWAANCALVMEKLLANAKTVDRRIKERN